MRSIILLLLVGLPIAGCGDDAASGTSASGLTEGEAQQLERAAERIDARAPSPAEPQSAALEADIRARLAAEQAVGEQAVGEQR